MRRILRSLCALLLAGAAAGAGPLAAQVAPDAAYSTFDTEHFRVTYQAGLETIARRAGERAERAWAVLARDFVRPPRGRVDLVLANNVDVANGYATPFPTNRIVVYAHPPIGESTLSFTEDWIELVVLHELVHIFHLDYAGGVWRPLRRVFGRNPALFPEVYAPPWVVEGLATHYESRFTRSGRVRGTQQDMVLRAAILEDAFFPIDRATGDPVTWPAGSTRYVYGSLFLEHLARRHGPERVAEYVREVGRQLVPYRSDAAARRAFGVSFTRAWRTWEDSLAARYGALADSLRPRGVTGPEVLTAAGRGAAYPRFSPDGRTIAYAASTGREEPSTRLLAADGSERVLAPRTTLGPTAWTPDGRVVYAQLDYVDPYRVYADLYRVGPGGEETRLTRAARVWEPDVHPDGRRVVTVADAEGAAVLEVRDLETGRTRRLTAADPGVGWSVPRWSPSGDRIAVARWLAGGRYDVVVLDTAGAVVLEVTRDRAVDDAPAWSPDGRYLLFSSDRSGIPDLYAYDTTAGRLLRVTRVLTGAFEPDVSPDGRWIAFSLYRSDGYHIARIPYDPASWEPAPEPRADLAGAPGPEGFERAAEGASRPYSPWRSLAPATWALATAGGTDLGVGVGAVLYGEDLVDRHRWGATGIVYLDGARLDGSVGYRYAGLGNPVLGVALSQDWAVYQRAGLEVGPGGAPLPTAVLSREREVDASLTWTRRRWRSLAWAGVGAAALDLDRVWDDPGRAPQGVRPRRFPLDLAASLEGGVSSARGYALSLGPQEGYRASGSIEAHRYADPFEGEEEARGYLRGIGRTRAYRSFALPGFARHVLAARLDAGAESGSVSPGFGAGGASGGSAPVPLDADLVGGSVTFPVRGYGEGAQRGNRAFAASAEYRFPLVLVERGVRVLPLFLERVWGDVFADAGSAWCPGTCERRTGVASELPRPLVSVGAELNVEAHAGFFVALPLRLGVALPLRDPGALTPEFYLRFGASF